jgi:predicted outer membrane protein
VIRSAAAALAALVVVAGAALAGTTSDGSGTMVLNGQKVFPLVLAKGPDPGTTTPDGTDAFAEVARAGATFLKVGPATVPWTAGDIADANTQDRAAAAAGLSTWVNLSTVSQATAGSSSDALLQQVVTSLKSDAGAPAIGAWKGADEPLWSGIQPSALQFAYCRATGRGSAAWCGGEPVLDADHQFVTIEAPRGTATQLQPYSAVTDIHGVDIYPVTLSATSPDLHQVGAWTSTIASVTPSHAVWTTIQVCASGSYNTSGQYVLPTFAQERYMAYDAIVNGARSLAFYGGNIPGCWSATDRQYGWNWTFWSSVLKPLLGELNASSPLAPALVNASTNQVLATSDSTTQAISRAGSGSDLWVIATRSGAGDANVTISGLPAGYASGTVYTENRTIPVTNGSFTDDFPQWAVHVYRFVPTPPPTTTTTTTTTTKSDDDSNKDDKGGGQNGSGKDDDDNKDGKGNGNRNEHAFCFDDICSTWDAQWLKMSIEGDRYEIAAGTLGLQKSSNPAIRTLAQTLVTDHTQSLQDAIDLAQKFHIDVPPEPSPVQQWILGDLAQHTGSQFDVEFSSVEVKDHQEDIDQAQTEVKCGVVPAIRSDADDELPMLHKHLELAQAALAASGGTH